AGLVLAIGQLEYRAGSSRAPLSVHDDSSLVNLYEKVNFTAFSANIVATGLNNIKSERPPRGGRSSKRSERSSGRFSRLRFLLLLFDSGAVRRRPGLRRRALGRPVRLDALAVGLRSSLGRHGLARAAVGRRLRRSLKPFGRRPALGRGIALRAGRRWPLETLGRRTVVGSGTALGALRGRLRGALEAFRRGPVVGRGAAVRARRSGLALPPGLRLDALPVRRNTAPRR